jgi:V/A-type H+-transporting ATPase subunit E
MEASESGRKALITGIEEDARREAEKLISDAKKKAGELERYTEKQVQSILADAEAKARSQSEAIRRKVLSEVDVEVRRKSLQLKERLFGEVLGLVKEELKGMVQTPQYRELLLDWIVEAAIGLGAEEALVSTSKDEEPLVDSQMLKQAEQRVKKLTGDTVKLKKSSQSEGERQGVVLTALDGKSAFNNLVATRLLRKQRDVRALIYRELFGE